MLQSFFKANSPVSIALIAFTSYYTVFLTTSLSTTSLCLIKSFATVSNLSISNLWTYDFKRAKSDR